MNFWGNTSTLHKIRTFNGRTVLYALIVVADGLCDSAFLPLWTLISWNFKRSLPMIGCLTSAIAKIHGSGSFSPISMFTDNSPYVLIFLHLDLWGKIHCLNSYPLSLKGKTIIEEPTSINYSLLLLIFTTERRLGDLHLIELLKLSRCFSFPENFCYISFSDI